MSDEQKDNLKVGDVMVLKGGGLNATRLLVTIDRLTPTQIIIGTRRFGRRRRSFGGTYFEIDKYSRSSITAATPELIAEVKAEQRRAAMLRQINAVKFDKLTDEQLEAIVAALPAPETAT